VRHNLSDADESSSHALCTHSVVACNHEVSFSLYVYACVCVCVCVHLKIILWRQQQGGKRRRDDDNDDNNNNHLSWWWWWRCWRKLNMYFLFFPATTLSSFANLGDVSLRSCSSQASDRCRSCRCPSAFATSCRRVFLHKSHNFVCSLCKTPCGKTSCLFGTSSSVCSQNLRFWSHHGRFVKQKISFLLLSLFICIQMHMHTTHREAAEAFTDHYSLDSLYYELPYYEDIHMHTYSLCLYVHMCTCSHVYLTSNLNDLRRLIHLLLFVSSWLLQKHLVSKYLLVCLFTLMHAFNRRHLWISLFVLCVIVSP